MTTRERKLAYGAGGATVFVVGFLAFQSLFLGPLLKSSDEIAALETEKEDKQLDLRKKLADKKELARLKRLSLPADPNPLHRELDLAWTEYDKYLRDLARGAGLKSARVSGSPPATSGPINARNKKPLYQPLSYAVDATGDPASVVALLERFYSTPLLHQITGLTLRPAKSDAGSRARRPGAGSRDVDVRMTVEALLVDGAEKRSYLAPSEGRLLAINGIAALQHGPAGLPLVPWAIDRSGLLQARPLLEAAMRDQYVNIPRKNIFYGPPAPKDPAKKRQAPKLDANKYLILTDIIRRSDGKVQASLYDQLKGGKPIKLDPADESFTSIPICKDTEDDKLVRGEVVHIGRSEVVFRVKLVSRKEKEESNGEKIICLDEGKRLYRMEKSYWDALEEEETITATSGSADGSNFLFRGKVMGGTVVAEEGEFVVFEIYPKYFDRLFALHVDESIETALAEPLTSRQIKELGMPEALTSAKSK